MGFLSKLWKGVKKTFKKVGKAIKKGVQKVGKFMDKIGIVGQIGLSLIMPGIGGMLGKWAGSMLAYQGAGAGIVNAAGTVLNAAVNVGSKVSSVFSTVTEGVTNVLGEVAGATLNEIGLGDTISKMGWDISSKSFSTVGNVASTAFDATKATVGDLFSKSTLTATNKFAQQAATEATAKALSSAGVEMPSVETLSDVGTDFTSELSLGTAEKPLFEVPNIVTPEIVTPETAFTPAPSLLDRGVEAITELPGKVGEAALNKIESAPEDIVEYGTDLVKDIATEKAYEAAGIDRTPDVDQRAYSTVVPGIQAIDYTSGVASNIGFISPMPSSQRLAQSPYGYGAALYNENTYAARMRAMV